MSDGRYDGWTVRNDRGKVWAYFVWMGVELFRSSTHIFSAKDEAREIIDKLETEIGDVDIVALVSSAIADGLLPEDTILPERVICPRAR